MSHQRMNRAGMAQAARLKYPTTTDIDGREFYVDRVGIVVGWRFWPLYEMPDSDEVELARQWLGQMSRIKKPGTSSYYLKHRAERWAGRYIGNGALILAAHQCGFRMSTDLVQGINANIAISRRSLSQLPEAIAQRPQAADSTGGIQ